MALESTVRSILVYMYVWIFVFSDAVYIRLWYIEYIGNRLLKIECF